MEQYDGPAPLPTEELIRRLRGKQGLVCVLTDRVSADVLASAHDLKVVANIAVGYDNIDIPAARAQGVVVTNTPDVLTDAVAEFTWALIFAVTRRIGEGERLVRRGGWKGWALDFMLGTELRGKQLGIIGRGRIGQAVAARASAFGVDAVFAARPASASPRLDQSKPGQSPGTVTRDSHGGQSRGTVTGDSHREPRGSKDAEVEFRAPAADVREMSLDELLISSDIISIHTPLTPETRHLIDRRALARMKRSAYLINTARGPVVDEEALAWALKEHLISGAALDVYEREPEVFPALLELENVVLAPHLGSATRETRTAMAELAVKNAVAVLYGRAPLTPVRS